MESAAAKRPRLAQWRSDSTGVVDPSTRNPATNPFTSINIDLLEVGDEVNGEFGVESSNDATWNPSIPTNLS
jgi:hypothetical protein